MSVREDFNYEVLNGDRFDGNEPTSSSEDDDDNYYSESYPFDDEND